MAELQPNLTFTAGADLEPNRLVTLRNTGLVTYTAAGEVPDGITTQKVLNGGLVACFPANYPGALQLSASKAIAIGAPVYPAANGQVSDAAGGGATIGKALTAAGGANAELGFWVVMRL